MELNDYSDLVLRTLVNSSPAEIMGLSFVGLMAEAGELADLYKKRRYHKHTNIDRAAIANEFGDLLWYIAAGARACDMPLSEVLPLALFDREAARDLRKVPGELRMAFALLHLAKAIGDFANAIVEDDTERSRYMPTWIGRCGYYVLMAAQVCKVTPAEIMDANVAKLERRYPGGVFSTAASMARADVGAR